VGQQAGRRKIYGFVRVFTEMGVQRGKKIRDEKKRKPQPG